MRNVIASPPLRIAWRWWRRIAALTFAATLWAMALERWDPWGSIATVLAPVALWRPAVWLITIDDRAAARRLARWCTSARISTPEVIARHPTELGERFHLRVTGQDQDAKPMTVATFASLAGLLRDVIGDECRSVHVEPDRTHGGRCTLDIQWRDRPERHAEVVQIGERQLRVVYSAEERAAAEAEAARRWNEESHTEHLEPTAPRHDETPAHVPRPTEAHAVEVHLLEGPIRANDETGGAGSGYRVEQSRPGPPRAGEAVEAECRQDQPEPCDTAAATMPIRPLDAIPGTRTGDLWDVALTGRHSLDWLAGRAGLTVKSAANSLRNWERLGFAARERTAQGDLWYVTCASIPHDGDTQDQGHVDATR